jgi:hypothetical protein
VRAVAIRRRVLKPVLVLVTGAVLGLGMIGTGGAQTAPPADDPPARPVAPAGFAAELGSLYQSVFDAAQNVRALGGPDDATAAPEDPAAFGAAVAQLTPEELGSIYAATREVEGWAALSASYRDLAEQTAQSAPSSTPRSIEPPPPAPEPGVPIEAIEPTRCPPAPPGPDFGNYSRFVAGAAIESVRTVVALIPPKLIILNGVSIPNPARTVMLNVLIPADIAVSTLDWLHDRHFYCEAENQYVQVFNAEAVMLEAYALLGVANGTIDNLNRGMIVLSDQVKQAQSVADQVLMADIQQALLAPSGSVANVAYMVPAEHGGYLDASPIGVRSLVTDALAAAQRARLPVGAAATTYLAQADAALSAGNYVGAYRNFQLAYQNTGRY